MTTLQLPVVARVQHRRYLPGTTGTTGTTPVQASAWGASSDVDSHGWWQPRPEEVGVQDGRRTDRIIRTLLVPHGTECGDRDRWTIPGPGDLLQVGEAQDYSYGPGGVTVPLVVHLSRTPESQMIDRCEIRNPDSWVTETQQPGSIAHQYNGSNSIPCRVEVDARQPRTAIVGGETVTLTSLSVTLPIEVCPAEDQVITITAARIDQALVGRRFDVKVADAETYALERRVLIVEHR